MTNMFHDELVTFAERRIIKMKKKLVIIGNGTYAAMMKRYIELTGFGMVYAFAVEKQYISESKFCDIPVVSIDKL